MKPHSVSLYVKSPTVYTNTLPNVTPYPNTLPEIYLCLDAVPLILPTTKKLSATDQNRAQKP